MKTKKDSSTTERKERNTTDGAGRKKCKCKPFEGAGAPFLICHGAVTDGAASWVARSARAGKTQRSAEYFA